MCSRIERQLALAGSVFGAWQSLGGASQLVPGPRPGKAPGCGE